MWPAEGLISCFQSSGKAWTHTSYALATESGRDKTADSLFHDAALDGHKGVVDLHKVFLAVFLQVHGVKVQLDDVAGVCSELPLDEGVGRVRLVGETWRLDLPDVVGPGVFWILKEPWDSRKTPSVMSADIFWIPYYNMNWIRKCMKLNRILDC